MCQLFNYKTLNKRTNQIIVIYVFKLLWKTHNYNTFHFLFNFELAHCRTNIVTHFHLSPGSDGALHTPHTFFQPLEWCAAREYCFYPSSCSAARLMQTCGANNSGPTTSWAHVQQWMELTNTFYPSCHRLWVCYRCVCLRSQQLFIPAKCMVFAPRKRGSAARICLSLCWRWLCVVSIFTSPIYQKHQSSLTHTLKLTSHHNANNPTVDDTRTNQTLFVNGYRALLCYSLYMYILHIVCLVCVFVFVLLW